MAGTAAVENICPAVAARGFRTISGIMPVTMHNIASGAIESLIPHGTSTAPEAFSVLGRPRKEIPKAFTKHAAASAPVRARAAQANIPVTIQRPETLR